MSNVAILNNYPTRLLERALASYIYSIYKRKFIVKFAPAMLTKNRSMNEIFLNYDKQRNKRHTVGTRVANFHRGASNAKSQLPFVRVPGVLSNAQSNCAS